MANTGVQLGQSFQTIMPAFTDNADIQQAMMMLWYGDANATTPTGQGIEAYLASLSSQVGTLAAKKTTDVIFSATAPARDTTNYSDWIWVNTSATNPDGASRPVSIWNGSAWSQIAGAADPSANYTWTGLHVFNQKITVKGPINSYATAADRTAGLPGVTNGTLSYINGRYEYYKDGAWVPIGSIEKTVETRSAVSTTMVEADADKILQFTNVSASTFTIPSTQIKVGTSVYINRNSPTPLTILAGSGVTFDARNSVLGQYASATLTKVAADSWIMQGTGTALPPGGTANQAPLKVDGSDYNVQWASVVPVAGGSFTGDVFANKLTVSDLNATALDVSGTATFAGNLAVSNGSLIIGGHKVFVQSTQPAGMSAGDVWIQI